MIPIYRGGGGGRGRYQMVNTSLHLSKKNTKNTGDPAITEPSSGTLHWYQSSTNNVVKNIAQKK